MKRMTALLLALALLAFAVPGMAEGQLNVAQENFYTVPLGSTYYGYLYAKLENTGDAPLKIDGGQLDVYDANGELLASTTTLWRYAEYLEPGEYTYAYFNKTLDGVESEDQVGKYEVSFNTRESNGWVTFRLPSETVFENDVTEGYWTHDYTTTTVNNDTDQTVYGVSAVRAVMDAQGNIVYIDSDSMYNNKGITSGSSIVVRAPMNSSFEKYYEEKGVVPVSADGIAYVNVEAPIPFTRGGAAPEPAVEEKPEGEAGQEADSKQEETAYVTLQKGSKGEDVRALQQRLKDLGYLTGKVDGNFGKGTAKAVKAFQKKAGLSRTGVADEETQKALFADDAPSA